MPKAIKRPIDFNPRSESVSELPTETRRDGMFCRVDNRDVIRLFDISDDSVYFYDYESSGVLLHFDSSCNVYGVMKLNEIEGLDVFVHLGRLNLRDAVWSFESYIKGLPDMLLNGESPMIAEILFFNEWYSKYHSVEKTE